MSVPVSAAARKNPSEKSSPYRYYAVAQSPGDMNFSEICELASFATTITKADISGSLEAVIKAIQMGLKEGRIIRMGEFGSLQVIVKKSEGADKQEEFHVSQVKKAGIIFRPGTELQNMVKTLKFHKVATRSKSVLNDDKDENGDFDI